ncbi:MAG: hypothetical protein EB150_05800 [Nitrososphaeria archaeon]|nr:hypothetical protein [Nitrososphaeria archaeon]NDB51803.1 hypothetical protein [Nitrosopumilaceae archaeon]NDB90900.1 hypothetical protein [Nitrososphaerota archaeon]NDB63609.1 hypothetical protein [Nitrosopumilaceae archaeon]NDB92272.1 hypothetical protein [Nitrososphaeria archaeon]
MKKILILFLLLVPFVLDANAHQPRLVMDLDSSNANPILIEDPEVSKAYYGRLEKSPEFYTISSNKEVDMYLSLQVPNLQLQSTNITVDLIDKKGVILVHLEGANHKWTEFHEDFGNADYLAGPSVRTPIPAGTYVIKISGDENTKYVLVTGFEERFPAQEFLNALALVSKINIEFFGMNPIQSMANIFGFMMIGFAIAVGFAILFTVRRIKSIRHK